VPSLAGAEPRRDRAEATESSYRDGALSAEPPPLTPPAPSGAAAQPAGSPAALPPAGLETPPVAATALPENLGMAAPARAELLPGPEAIDTPERMETAKVAPLAAAPPGEQAPAGERLRESPQDKPASAASAAQEQAQAPPSLPKPARDPAFRGNQEKTKMEGSISRKGKAALDVADTPLGRFQAQLSRAVELEWQRNCVRYRDLITPGFITVRFVIDSKGKITALSFVEAVEVGEVQKGFTANSIRKAQIPPMPAALARELNGEPLELTFNFYF